MTLYKVLGENGRPCHGGTGAWSLPNDGQPGEWMPALTGSLTPCEHAYHACSEGDIVCWLGPHIYTIEFRDEVADGVDKVYGREARLLEHLDTWNPRTMRLFAADCAERVLPLYEARHTGDPTVRNCIEMARRYARGEATESEMHAAANAHAASRAAHAAANAARVARSYASFYVNYDDAAAYAHSANAAERQWQTERLMQYLRGEA